MMFTVIDMMKTAATNRMRYVAMRDEIAKLPANIALDIGVFPGDAERIAHEAVYGKAA